MLIHFPCHQPRHFCFRFFALRTPSQEQPLYRAKSRARAAPIEPEKGVSPDAAPVPDCCEAEFVVVEVLWVVVVAVLEAPEVDALPLALALAEPLDEALALPEVVEEPDLHTTWSGMVTSAVEQICLAKVTAALLPAASQSLSRQQAMPSRNSVLLQMHLMSSWAQLAIWVPVVYWTRQDLAHSGTSPSWAEAKPAARARMIGVAMNFIFAGQIGWLKLRILDCGER